jgi:hypothetical protein
MYILMLRAHVMTITLSYCCCSLPDGVLSLGPSRFGAKNGSHSGAAADLWAGALGHHYSSGV